MGQRSAKVGVISELGRLAKKLESLPPADLGRLPPNIEEIAQEIRACITGGIGLTNRQVRQAAWCLWNKNTRLVEDGATRSAIFEHIAVAPHAGAFRALASNFLEAFQPNESGLEEAANLLRDLCPKWPGNWATLQQTYNLFDIDQGPKALAKAVASQDRAPHLILQDAGVGLMSAQGGYVRSVTGELLDYLADGGEPDHERRLGKVQRYALTEAGKAIFGDLMRQIAEAILVPFKGIKPPKPLLDKALAILVKVFGDPRLHPARWQQVPAGLTTMIRAWLAEQSLRQFLDVVGDSTNRPDQWRYRRAFWEGIYNMGLVSEAWVAFGPIGGIKARQRFGKEVSCGSVETSGKGVESGHAVLFLRIGDALVADWSHNGKCNIWSRADLPDAPNLYRLKYGSGEVVIPSSGNLVTVDRLSVSHTSTESYGWQRKVAERIRVLTGRRIQETDYVVR